MAAAIVALSHGLQVTDPALAGGSAPAASGPGSASLLTPREQDVLQILAEGLPNKGVASRLGVTEHTVKFHVNSIMGKLNAQSRTEAVALATRLGLLPL
jgi:DNA-binding NarL/FixJ family response regulator